MVYVEGWRRKKLSDRAGRGAVSYYDSDVMCLSLSAPAEKMDGPFFLRRGSALGRLSGSLAASAHVCLHHLPKQDLRAKRSSSPATSARPDVSGQI